MKFGNLEVVYSSGPSEYENLVLEVLLEGEKIIMIDRELGFDCLEAELFGTDENLRVKVNFMNLLDALNEIKKAFGEMNQQYNAKKLNSD